MRALAAARILGCFSATHFHTHAPRSSPDNCAYCSRIAKLSFLVSNASWQWGQKFLRSGYACIPTYDSSSNAHTVSISSDCGSAQAAERLKELDAKVMGAVAPREGAALPSQDALSMVPPASAAASKISSGAHTMGCFVSGGS